MKLFVVGVVTVLVAVPSAFAQGPTQSGYGGEAGNAAATVQSTGSLPFTGLDLALVVAGGLFLILVGTALRFRGRQRPS